MRSVLYMLLVVSYFTPSAAFSQELTSVHQATATPSNARYEIIQSEIAAKWTFRLDRFTGRVSQLVTTKDGDYTWEELVVVNRVPVVQPARARYQLFTSGIAARFTFLIDTDTGTTWQLTTTKEKLPDGTEQEVYSWQPLVE